MIQDFDLENWSVIDDSDDVHLYINALLSNEYVEFNTTKEYLNEKSVRQAIAHMVDEKEIIKDIYHGVGRQIAGLLQKEVLGYDEDLEGLEYNRERAKELMNEAGFDSGFNLTMIISDEVREHEDVAAYMQEQLQEINIDLNIEMLEHDAYINALNNGEHDLFITEWQNPVGDPDQGLYPLFHSSMIGTESNWTYFENEKVDVLLEAGRKENDVDQREEIYQEIEAILMEEQLLISIKRPLSTIAFNSVTGLSVNQNDQPNFNMVHLNIKPRTQR